MKSNFAFELLHPTRFIQHSMFIHSTIQNGGSCSCHRFKRVGGKTNPRKNKKMDKKGKREGIFYKHNSGTYQPYQLSTGTYQPFQYFFP